MDNEFNRYGTVYYSPLMKRLEKVTEYLEKKANKINNEEKK